MSLAILPLLKMDLLMRNNLSPQLFTIININDDFNILYRLELLIPSHGKGTPIYDMYGKNWWHKNKQKF